MYFTDEPEHITQLRDTLRRFAAAEMPREKVRAWDKANAFDRGVFDKLAALGVCGLTIDEAYVDMETGVGLVSGQGSSPQVQLAVSKDNGRTFGTPRMTTLGLQSQYLTRAIWRRWGSARVFVFKLDVTDPVKFAVTSVASSAIARPQQ